jgi:hypothetical protein
VVARCALDGGHLKLESTYGDPYDLVTILNANFSVSQVVDKTARANRAGQTEPNATRYNSATRPSSTSHDRSNRTFCSIRRSCVTNNSAPS